MNTRPSRLSQHAHVTKRPLLLQGFCMSWKLSQSLSPIVLLLLQGEIFAAEGYAKTTGDVGVCIATSGPGATNLVTGLADALLDSVPMVAITGQVPRKLIGTDAFQETPIVEVTRQITKHNYLVMDVADLPRYACLATSLKVCKHVLSRHSLCLSC